MKRYTIVPQSSGLGGWLLRLIENDQEISRQSFPLPPADEGLADAWWSGLTFKQRGDWMLVAGSAKPADAWREAVAYNMAEKIGKAWVQADHQPA